MNYINKDERVKSRRQFILLFSLAVILTVAIAGAFIISLNYNPRKEVKDVKVLSTIDKQPGTIIREVLVNDTASQNLASSLKKQLDEKNEMVNRLQQQVNILKQASRRNKPAPQSFGEISFYKLALRSQSSQILELKKENQKLKQQIN